MQIASPRCIEDNFGDGKYTNGLTNSKREIGEPLIFAALFILNLTDGMKNFFTTAAAYLVQLEVFKRLYGI